MNLEWSCEILNSSSPGYHCVWSLISKETIWTSHLLGKSFLLLIAFLLAEYWLSPSCLFAIFSLQLRSATCYFFELSVSMSLIVRKRETMHRHFEWEFKSLVLGWGLTVTCNRSPFLLFFLFSSSGERFQVTGTWRWATGLITSK